MRIFVDIFNQAVADLLINSYKETLKERKKYVTGKTLDSIEYEQVVTPTMLTTRVYADRSLLFIEKGRRKGAKLPVKKTPDGFELVDGLLEWVHTVHYTGSHFLLARNISKYGIKAVPITDLALQKIRPGLEQLIRQYLIPGYVDALRAEVKSIFL